MDLGDLRSIFESKNEIDRAYVRDQMKRLGFAISREFLPFVPKGALKGAKIRER